MTFNLAIILRESAASLPDKDFLRFETRPPMTFAEVDAASDRVAGALIELGLAPGDKVAVQLGNSAEFVVSYFAILKAALVMVPLNPQLKSREITHHLLDSDAQLLITSEALSVEISTALEHCPGISIVAVGPVNGSSWPGYVIEFDQLLEADPISDTRRTDPDDTAALLYTSGTTGQPKGAELSHLQLYLACTIGAAKFGTSAHDVALAILPLFHVYGLSSILNTSTRYGRTVCVLPRFEVETALAAIERERVTIIAGVPSMYYALAAADNSRFDTSSLRIGSSGGAAIPEPVLRAFEQKYNTVVLEGYGLSESASTAITNSSADERRVLSIGKPIWGLELRIVDPEGHLLPRGPEHVGEMLLRGPTISNGYHKRPQDTAEAFIGGWLRTGDLGYVDEDGYVFVVDRKKDLIIRGGFNVYPREVEDLLHQHPMIAEAAVIGRPDPRLGEEIVAVVTSRPGAAVDPQEVIAWTKVRIASYKYPREVIVLHDLPKGATGKILKTRLRERLMTGGPSTSLDARPDGSRALGQSVLVIDRICQASPRGRATAGRTGSDSRGVSSASADGGPAQIEATA